MTLRDDNYNPLMAAYLRSSSGKKSRRSKEDKIIDILIQQRIRVLSKVMKISLAKLAQEMGEPASVFSLNGSFRVISLIKLIMFLRIDPNTFFRPIMKTFLYYKQNNMIAKIPLDKVSIEDEILN